LGYSIFDEPVNESVDRKYRHISVLNELSTPTLLGIR